MAILTLNTPSELLVDLRGEKHGNAFALLGLAERLGKTLGFPAEQRETIQKQLKDKDYVHLVHVMEYYFGDYINFVLPETLLNNWDPNYSIFENTPAPQEVEIAVHTKPRSAKKKMKV